MLTFDEATHTYYYDGVKVANVTRVIAHLTDYSRIPPEQLRKAQQEGKAVHKMVELECRGELDVASLYSDPEQQWLAPRYEAFMKFKDETGFECWASEKQMYLPGIGVAGTLDLQGIMPKLNIGPSILDVKRSLFAGPAIGLQLAGYKRIHNGIGPREARVPDGNRFALQLRADGTYRLTRFQDAEDDVAFLACVQQYRWREKHYGETHHGST